MKSFVTGLLLIAFGVALIPSLADASGFTDWRDIEWVYQRSCAPDRGLEIRLATPHDNPDGCTNQQVLEVQCAVVPYDTAVDIALTTMAIGGQLRAYVNGCDGEGHAIVKALQARPPQPPAE